jgi:hypothetical protein
MLFALAIFVAIAVTSALPNWGLGLLTACMGVSFVALSKLFTEGVVRRANDWRQAQGKTPIDDTDDPPATSGETAAAMYDEGDVRMLLVTLFNTGLLFSAPILFIVGLMIAAADGIM